jgi:hypothetical protein
MQRPLALFIAILMVGVDGVFEAEYIATSTEAQAAALAHFFYVVAIIYAVCFGGAAAHSPAAT